MQDLSVASVTEAALAQMADTPDPRLRAVMASLVRHLHDFAREVALTPEEWVGAIGFLTQTGQACTPARQEFILLSDVLGLSALVNLMHDRTGASAATEGAATVGSLLGPFYQQGSPRYENGEQIARHVTGPLLQVYGQVRDTAGQGVPHATVQVWQTDSDGAYDLQTHGGALMDVRGTFIADADGRFHFQTIRPQSYAIPLDGPVGDVIRAQRRHGYRPAHIHFMIAAPGHRELVTALYFAADPYIGSDTVFGVSRALMVTPREDPDAPEPGIPAIRYDFTLLPDTGAGTGRVGADPAQFVVQAGVKARRLGAV